MAFSGIFGRCCSIDMVVCCCECGTLGAPPAAGSGGPLKLEKSVSNCESLLRSSCMLSLRLSEPVNTHSTLPAAQPLQGWLGSSDGRQRIRRRLHTSHAIAAFLRPFLSFCFLLGGGSGTVIPCTGLGSVSIFGLVRSCSQRGKLTVPNLAVLA